MEYSVIVALRELAANLAQSMADGEIPYDAEYLAAVDRHIAELERDLNEIRRRREDDVRLFFGESGETS
jgi:hypothetical protein